MEMSFSYLLIPFLLELRTIMDWMFTDTALGLSSWLQLEDIYSNVYLLKCSRWAELVEMRVRIENIYEKVLFLIEISDKARSSASQRNEIWRRWFSISFVDSINLVSITILFIHIIILSTKSTERSEC